VAQLTSTPQPVEEEPVEDIIEELERQIVKLTAQIAALQ